MELLIATWSVRLALISVIAVGGLSLSVGASPLDAAIRAAGGAFAFTLGGRVLLAKLESPGQRLDRIRAVRAAKRRAGSDLPAEAEVA